MEPIKEWNKKWEASNLSLDVSPFKSGDYQYKVVLTSPSGKTVGLKIGTISGSFHFLPLEEKLIPNEEAEYLYHLLDFVDLYCENLGIDVSFAQEKLFIEAFGKEITTRLFLEYNYKFIDILTSRTLRLMNVLGKTSSGFIKDRRKDSLKVSDIKEVWHDILTQFNLFSNQDPILFMTDEPRFQKSIPFYYEGTNGFLNFSFTDGHFSILSQGKTFLLSTLDDIPLILKDIFGDIKNKKRMRNMFEPPSFHFDRLMDEVGLLFNQNTKKEVLAALSQLYSPHNVEEICAHELKKSELFTLDDYHFHLFKVDKSLFISDKNRDVLLNYYELSKGDQAIAEYKGYISEFLSSKLDNAKNELLKSLVL